MTRRSPASKSAVSRETPTRPALASDDEAPVEFASPAARHASLSLAELVAADASPLHFVNFDDASGAGFQWFTNGKIAEVFASIHTLGGKPAEVESR